MTLSQTCIHFIASKPCDFHKKFFVTCDSCQYFQPIQKKILIIKLGAMGDVLRTTALLHRLKSAGNGVEITWITKPASLELLQNVYVNRVFSWQDPRVIPMLLTEEFDAVYSLDNDYDGAVFCAIVKAREKFGFTVYSLGKVQGLNPAADEWLGLSTHDLLKKQNTQTYQFYLFHMCGLEFDFRRDTILLPDLWAREDVLAIQRQLPKGKPVWGLVTGAGKRWPYKSISYQKMRELAQKLVPDLPCVCCYRTQCQKPVLCYDSFSLEPVYNILEGKV